MKNTTLFRWIIMSIMVALLAWFIIQKYCKPRCRNAYPTHKICQGLDTIFMKHDSVTRLVPLVIRCNEVILNPGVQNAAELRSYLKRLCFEKRDSCHCGPHFELWVNPDVNGIDVGVVVSGAPKIGGVGLGLLPNVVLSLPEPIDTMVKDTLPIHENLAVPCLNAELPPVQIGIVDSGVDPSSDPAINGLHAMEWHGYNLFDRCIQNVYPLGVECLSGRNNLSPVDSNGHGTSVNAVLVGASHPNFNMKIPLNFVNVDVMKGHTKSGTLYDALCGLYYALEQEVKIINVSWGFRCLNTLKHKDIFTAVEHAFNKFLTDANHHNNSVLVIAGAGNDTNYLTDYDYFFPASLACCHDNLISVGALNKKSTIDYADFSNYANLSTNFITLLAPGDEVITVYPKYLQSIAGFSTPTGYAMVSGTSFAAPYISRVSAMIRAIHPSKTAAEVKLKLIDLSKIESSGLRSVDFRVIDFKGFGTKVCDPLVVPL